MLRLGLGLTARGGVRNPAWLPTGALAAVNYSGSSIQRYRASRSFSRSSTGTYLDASGVLQTAAIDALRINYDGSGNRLGALLEVARTNSLTKNSEDLSTWSEGSGVATLDAAVVDPAGNTGTVYYMNGSFQRAAFNGLNQTVIGGSFFCKQRTGSGSDNIKLGFYQNLTGTPVPLETYTFSMTSANADSTYVKNVTRTALDNGWFRFQFQCNSNPAGGTGVFTSSARAELSGVSTNYFWGADIEVGASITSSYIKTTTAAATRAADAETISPSDQASSFDWHVKYDDDSTGIIATAVTGAFDVDPATLTRPNVKMIWAEAAA